MNLYLSVFFSFFTLFELQAEDRKIKGEDECFHIVHEVLLEYQRPFTLLGIGQEIDTIIRKGIVRYPDSVFVVLDKSLENKSSFASRKNTLWLNHQLNYQEIQNLASCEHVDFLLLTRPLYTFEAEWRSVLKTFQKMAHRILIKLSKELQISDRISSLDLQLIHKHLSQIAYKVVSENSSSIYYLLEGETPFYLVKTTLIHPRKIRWGYEIQCDYNQKYLKKLRPNWSSISSWIPGINMMTYLMFNGAIPSRPKIIECLPMDSEHTDWVPNNMVIQGSKVILIDKDDPVSAPISPDGGERVHRLETKAKEFILKTPNMTPKQVRESFISIYNWGTYFDQIEIDE